MKAIFYLILLVYGTAVSAQEFLAEVTVDYSALQTSNTQIYKTLEKSLKDYINNTKWTDEKYEPAEKIQCSFFLLLTEKSDVNSFKGSLTIQSRRPVYNSTYFTPMLNFVDTDFSFKYTEFENFVFNDRAFSGKNLIDVISFYLHIILGYDKDSFSKLGGTQHFQVAQRIANNSESQNFEGWSSFDGYRNRSVLIKDLLSTKTNILRELQYNYHINSLDKFYTNELIAKNNLVNNIMKLTTLKNQTQLYPLDLFIQVKKEELKKIFSDGKPTTANLQKMKELLEEIAPTDKEEYWDLMTK